MYLFPGETSPDCAYTVSGMQEDVDYEYRVAAENKAGAGPPSDPTKPTRYTEKIYFTKELTEVKVNAIGKPATLECEISKDGLKVEWYHGSRKLRRGEEYDIVADGKTHKLVIEKVTEELVGDYKAEYKTISTQGSLKLAGKWEF